MNSAEKKFLYLALFLFALGGVSRLGFFNKLSPLEMIPLLPAPELSEPVQVVTESAAESDSAVVADSLAPTDSEATDSKKEKKTKAKKKAPAFPININTASKEDLCFIKGVGPSVAQKIIDYREQKGPFKSAKDLEKISGIGAKKRAAMEEFVKVE